MRRWNALFRSGGGASPGEQITFTSPQLGTLLPGTANGSGVLSIRWQCNPNEAGTSWTVTARGSSSGRTVRIHRHWSERRWWRWWRGPRQRWFRERVGSQSRVDDYERATRRDRQPFGVRRRCSSTQRHWLPGGKHVGVRRFGGAGHEHRPGARPVLPRTSVGEVDDVCAVHNDARDVGNRRQSGERLNHRGGREPVDARRCRAESAIRWPFAPSFRVLHWHDGGQRQLRRRVDQHLVVEPQHQHERPDRQPGQRLVAGARQDSWFAVGRSIRVNRQ